MNNGYELLVAKLFAGGLSASESSRLNRILEESPELRTDYQRLAMTHSILQWHHGGVWQSDQPDIDPLAIAELLVETDRAAKQQEKEEAAEIAEREARLAQQRKRIAELELRNRRRPEPIVIPYSVAYAGVAALAASVMWIAYTLFTTGDPSLAANQPQQQIAAEAPLVAKIAGSVEARLVRKPEQGADKRSTYVPLAPGTRLATGQYDVVRGVISLKFDGGTAAVVEAPASFTLVSADRMEISRGRIVGNVPPGSIGFTVTTPTATIVDLGTEFGIAIDENNASDVSVFDGEVEVVATATKGISQELAIASRQRLTADTSLRVNLEGTFSESETADSLYFRKVPSSRELKKKQAYERWLAYSKKLAADPDVLAYYTFDGQSADDELLLNRAGDGASLHGSIQGAYWEEGRWPQKQALRFASDDPQMNPSNYVQIDIPGQFDTVTLAAWVYVDIFSQHHTGLSGLLMSDEWTQDGQMHWQFRGDGRLQSGTYTESSGGHEVFAEIPLRQNELGYWHHVALVAQVKSQRMTFYLDGKHVGSESYPEANEIIFGSSRIGGWKPTSDVNRGAAPDEWRTLHGKIDELLMLDRALSDNEIIELYEMGRP